MQPPPSPDAALLALPRAGGSDLRPAERNGLVGAVIAAHLLGLWGLMQVAAVQDVVRQVAPRVLDFVSVAPPPRPTPPPPPPAPAPLPPQPVPRAPVPTPPPLISTAPTATPAPFVAPQPVEPPPPAPVAVAAPAPVAPPAPPAPPPAPPQPKLLPASNIAYLVPPPIELPLASRRLGEQGLVQLRVLVGVDGLPRQVSVQRSSGFARLDEQAVSAMKRARFKPQTDQGVPIEWIVIAPLQYEIE